MKVLAGVLVLVIAGLVWAVASLDRTRKELAAQLATEQQGRQSNEIVILDFSNRWAMTRRTLEEQKSVNVTLETNLTARARQLETLRTEISGLNSDLAKTKAEVKSAQEEIAKRDAQINTLENRNVDLTKQMGDLEASIAGLEQKINETERRLATSEGNRQDLLRELKRLQTEKLSLEKQLNDLAFVREQVRKLKEELTIARRLDWIRRGLYTSTPRKGVETLSTLTSAPRTRDTNAAPGSVGADAPSLDVELKTSGEVKITPPAPAAVPAPKPQ